MTEPLLLPRRAQSLDALRRSLACACAIINELHKRDMPFAVERIEASGERATIYYHAGQERQRVEQI